MATIFFDFDGTIADSFDVILQIFYELTGRTERFNAAEITQFRSMKPPEIARELGLPRWKIPVLLSRGQKMIHKRMADIPPFAGMPEIIKNLHESGHQLFVISTNSSANVNLFLAEHELADYFVSVKGSAGITGKRRAIKVLLRRHKLKAGNCYYIGDEVRDIVAAKGAGVRSLAVAWGFSDPGALADMKPDGLAKSPSDIPRLIQ